MISSNVTNPKTPKPLGAILSGEEMFFDICDWRVERGK